jgi:hypothetical protein
MKKDEVLAKLRELKPRYEEDGVVICGIFGSLARGEEDVNSDIDIAYKLDEKLFFSKYSGFTGASKLTSIAKELEIAFQKRVDFVSINSINRELNTAIKRDLVI